MADESSSSSGQRQGLLGRLMENKTSTALCVLRILTLVYSALYSIPFIGSPTAFYRCLMVYVGVSYLRATQRLPRIQFTRVYWRQVLMEDSVHYLLYSFTFLNSFPLSLMLISVSLFSILHVINFLKSISELLPISIADRVQGTSQILEANSIQIYRIIAFSEVVTFPVVLVSVFIGIEPLLVPIMHYQFLALRYSSRRFPYTRLMFAELRVFTEQFAARPACPSFIRQLLNGFVKLVSRLAPATEYSMPERP